MELTRKEKLLWKGKLKQFCLQMLEQRIAQTKSSIEEAQAAANKEEKSSAGDKYETSRAMSHLEKDMHSRQLMAHLQAIGSLRSIDVECIYDVATAGAFIQCNSTSFFIAAGLGKQVIDNVTVIFISPPSPLAKSIIGKRKGDVIDYNNKSIIEDVY